MTEEQFLRNLKSVIQQCSAPSEFDLHVKDDNDVISLNVECVYPGDHIGLIDFDALTKQLQADLPQIVDTTYSIDGQDGFKGRGIKPTGAVVEGELSGRRLTLVFRCADASPA